VVSVFYEGIKLFYRDMEYSFLVAICDCIGIHLISWVKSEKNWKEMRGKVAENSGYSRKWRTYNEI